MDCALRQWLMTFDEVARLDPDEHWGEVDEGRVTESGWPHGEIVANVTTLLFD